MFHQPTHRTFADIISEATEIIRDRAQGEVPPLLLVAWVSEACQQFALRSESVHKVERRVLINEEDTYRLPPDCLRPERVDIDYPGIPVPWMLNPIHERDQMQREITFDPGRPYDWYITEDRKNIVLVPAPIGVGEASTTTSAGNIGGTTAIATGLSDEDDAYVDMLFRIVEGALEGEEQTISAYTASSGTFTFSSAFSAQVPSGIRFEVRPDSLTINYRAAGNQYIVFPTAASVQASPAPSYSTFAVNLPDRPPGFWDGCEVYFTSGSLMDLKTRIESSTSISASSTTITVHPELPIKPTAADTVSVRGVPNIPDAFQHFLVEYVVWKALRRFDPQAANNARKEFEFGIEEAKRMDMPAQGGQMAAMRQYAYGEPEY